MSLALQSSGLFSLTVAWSGLLKSSLEPAAGSENSVGNKSPPGCPIGWVVDQACSRRNRGLNCLSFSFMTRATSAVIAARSTCCASSAGALCLMSRACCRNENSASACPAAADGCRAATVLSAIPISSDTDVLPACVRIEISSVCQSARIQELSHYFEHSHFHFGHSAVKGLQQCLLFHILGLCTFSEEICHLRCEMGPEPHSAIGNSITWLPSMQQDGAWQ